MPGRGRVHAAFVPLGLCQPNFFCELLRSKQPHICAGAEVSYLQTARHLGVQEVGKLWHAVLAARGWSTPAAAVS